MTLIDYILAGLTVLMAVGTIIFILRRSKMPRPWTGRDMD